MRIISQKYLEVSEFIHTFALPNINYMNELENIQNHIYKVHRGTVPLCTLILPTQSQPLIEALIEEGFINSEAPCESESFARCCL